MASAPIAPRDALSDAQYHALAMALLSGIELQIDRWLQHDVVDIDTARTGGLLELSLPDGSKLVVNTQPPLQEIWLAARRGGFHFRQLDGRWRDTKTDQEFYATLSDCASEQSGRALRFEAPAG
jgi:CyaY protein